MAKHEDPFCLHSIVRCYLFNALAITFERPDQTRPDQNQSESTADEFLLVLIKQFFEEGQSVWRNPLVHCVGSKKTWCPVTNVLLN